MIEIILEEEAICRHRRKKEVVDTRQKPNRFSALSSIVDFSLLPFVSFYDQEAFGNRKDGVILCCVINPFNLHSELMWIMGLQLLFLFFSNRQNASCE